MLTVVLTDFEDRYNPRMNDFSGRLGLGIKAFDVGLVGKLPSQDHLERDGAVEAKLPCLEDNAHAAAGNLANDLEWERRTTPSQAEPDRPGPTRRGIVTMRHASLIVTRRWWWRNRSGGRVVWSDRSPL